MAEANYSNFDMANANGPKIPRGIPEYLFVERKVHETIVNKCHDLLEDMKTKYNCDMVVKKAKNIERKVAVFFMRNSDDVDESNEEEMLHKFQCLIDIYSSNVSTPTGSIQNREETQDGATESMTVSNADECFRSNQQHDLAETSQNPNVKCEEYKESDTLVMSKFPPLNESISKEKIYNLNDHFDQACTGLIKDIISKISNVHETDENIVSNDGNQLDSSTASAFDDSATVPNVIATNVDESEDSCSMENTEAGVLARPFINPDEKNKTVKVFKPVAVGKNDGEDDKGSDDDILMNGENEERKFETETETVVDLAEKKLEFMIEKMELLQENKERHDKDDRDCLKTQKKKEGKERRLLQSTNCDDVEESENQSMVSRDEEIREKSKESDSKHIYMSTYCFDKIAEQGGYKHELDEMRRTRSVRTFEQLVDYSDVVRIELIPKARRSAQEDLDAVADAYKKTIQKVMDSLPVQRASKGDDHPEQNLGGEQDYLGDRFAAVSINIEERSKSLSTNHEQDKHETMPYSETVNLKNIKRQSTHTTEEKETVTELNIQEKTKLPEGGATSADIGNELEGRTASMDTYIYKYIKQNMQHELKKMSQNPYVKIEKFRETATQVTIKFVPRNKSTTENQIWEIEEKLDQICTGLILEVTLKLFPLNKGQFPDEESIVTVYEKEMGKRAVVFQIQESGDKPLLQIIGKPKEIETASEKLMHLGVVKADKPSPRRLLRDTNELQRDEKTRNLDYCYDKVQDKGGKLTFTTGQGVKVMIYQGNLVKQATYAIVNAANERLGLVGLGGVAGAIYDAAGNEMQEYCNQYTRIYGYVKVGEVALTEACGNLRCKVVIHAVGPRKSEHFNEKELLKSAVLNSILCCNKELEENRRESMHGISIPAISSGLFAVEMATMLWAFREAIFEFDDMIKRGCINYVQEIHLVNIDTKTTDAFKSYFREEIAKCKKQADTTEVEGGRPSNSGGRYGIQNREHGITQPHQRSQSEQRWFKSIPGSNQGQSQAAAGFTWNPNQAYRGYPSQGSYEDELRMIPSTPGSYANVVRVQSSNPTGWNHQNMYNSTSGSTPRQTHARSSNLINNGRNALPKSGSNIEDDQCCICLYKIKNPRVLPCKDTFCTDCIYQHEKFNGPKCPVCFIPFGKKKGNQPLGTCCICLDKIRNPKVLPCKDTFCKDCIDQNMEFNGPKCPVCFEPFGKKKGNQPLGTCNMTVSSYPVAGYEGYGSIKIDYNIPSGIQTERHPNPGQHFSGTSRTAFLPNTNEGKDIAKLLKQAFNEGHIFTVGRSVTNNKDNCVVWNDIHHKTQIRGSLYGYPDATYLRRVREELRAKGIVSVEGDRKYAKK